METVIEAIGEVEEQITEKKPQLEHLQWIKGPGDFTEDIKITGSIPEGKYVHVKVVIQIRDATDGEIAFHMKEKAASE